ncbi:type III secretion system ATPase SctN [Erwiniaceae bacterium BAC15a-03b]|uniref:Flagellum-specific ATP synthase n=1 Tax=Winslowiella arboricola TaxID=2978220 RepID=A0A9J6PSF7_9GAMM|nr:type III secretion system ATPase SctN [Winslowiella arboricola]MCU5773766.1 type III secretion system ATPase SctN [Winslowiella arboricola]MCU5777676.1 type III secretion system ATPase SctN [Winslowiella arboricola]
MLVRYQAHPLRVTGPIVEARLSGVKIGEVCHVHRSDSDNTVVARAQVLGFERDSTLLSLIGSAEGLSRDMVISPTGHSLMIEVSENLAGTVLTPSGEVIERLSPAGVSTQVERRLVYAAPPCWDQRRGISELLTTGVRAIDGLITCGVGQRMGIFSAAGCGKTTLMQMLINNAEAGIVVVALIGERGREVTEFVEALREMERKSRCVLVYATSDYPALDRVNAAASAMTIAEYFRDRGINVLLFIDSITRYARALRDVALAAGEPPARRGYPASVFEKLPALLERPGRTRDGSITAFFTILLENEEESDPVAEEVRSIIDGHIVLSRKLASKNHYPAIDVLHSLSRVSQRVTSDQHQTIATDLRDLLARIEEIQVLIDFGEYQPGLSPANDKAFNAIAAIRRFLCQPLQGKEDIQDTLIRMQHIVK